MTTPAWLRALAALAIVAIAVSAGADLWVVHQRRQALARLDRDGLLAASATEVRSALATSSDDALGTLEIALGQVAAVAKPASVAGADVAAVQMELPYYAQLLVLKETSAVNAAASRIDAAAAAAAAIGQAGLARDRHAATAGSDVVAVGATALLAFVVLGGVQLFVAVRSHRVVNVGLASATLVVAALAIFSLGRLASARDLTIRGATGASPTAVRAPLVTARHRLRILVPLAAAGGLAAMASTLAGVRPRLAEYR